MTLRMCKRRPSKETTEHTLPTLQPSYAVPDSTLKVTLVGGAVVAQRSSFEMFPYTLVGVEFAGVGRQVLDPQPRVCLQPAFDQLAAMDAGIVPEYDDPAFDVSQKGRQKEQHLVAFDAAAYQMQIQPSVTGDAGYRRELRPTEGMTDNRRLATPRPSPAGRRDERKAAFVHKYQARTPASGVFFTWG